MSDTRRGKRPIGYEYWSRRHLSRNGGASPGRVTKKLTHRRERAEERRDLHRAKSEAA